MRIALTAAVTCLTLSVTAYAEVKKLASRLEVLGDEAHAMESEPAPKFAFTMNKAYVNPPDFSTARPAPSLGWWTQKVVLAEATDKQAAWIAADVGEHEPACGAPSCTPPRPKVADYHASMLLERVGTDWRYVTWHIAWPVTAQAQAKAVSAGVTPSPLTREIGAGAEEVVKLFETSIADPKALAASVSTRKDVVLYGSALKERTVGGAKVKAMLARWKLAFKVRDGIQAGLTSSRSVAWLAANVDAGNPKKPKDKPVPYRLLVLYEKTAAGWKLVQAHFSFTV